MSATTNICSPRVLLLTADFPPLSGGIADFLHNICNLLREDVVVLTPRMPDDIHSDAQQVYRVIRLPIQPESLWQRNSILPLQWIRKTASLMKTENVGTVVGGFASAAILLTLWYVRHRYRVRTRLIVHGGDVLALRLSRIRRILVAPLLKHVDLFITNSHFTRQVLTDTFHIGPQRISVLHPGVVYSRFRQQGIAFAPGWPDERKRILTVGRLVEHKGFDRLIEASAQLAEQGVDVGCIVVGKGQDRPRLERLALSLGVVDRVHFAGFVSDADLPAYYQSCDVFALLSRQPPSAAKVEGFGIVFLEAAACGKPAIGGRSGGTTDAVVDGETGLLVDPTSINAIVRALYMLLTDGDLARRLGETGRSRVMQQFDWSRRGAEVRKAFLEAADVQT